MKYGGVYTYPSADFLRDATIHDVIRQVRAGDSTSYVDPHTGITVLVCDYDKEAEKAAQELSKVLE